jgi:hypothetical protein
MIELFMKQDILIVITMIFMYIHYNWKIDKLKEYIKSEVKK